MIVRTTFWHDEGDLVQLAVYCLDSTTWEELVGTVKQVGPFDDGDELLARVLEETVAYATHQVPGQRTIF